MSVICKEAYFNSSSGNNKVRCLIWEDNELEPVGVMQIVHGIWADISLYKTLGNFLASCGFVVYAHDHLGHGKTVNNYDEIGDLPADADIFVLNDIHILRKIIKKRHPGLPFFLFGDSSGCTVNRAYCDRFVVDGIDGIIFCSIPYLPYKALNAFKDYLAFAMNNLGVPATRRSPVHNSLSKFLEFEKSRNFNFIEPAIRFISQDKEYVKKRINPDLWFSYTYRAWYYLMKLAEEGHEDRWINEVPPGFPVLILSGTLDSVGAKGKFAMEFAKKLEDSGINCHLILYPNNSHDIINTMDNDKALQDILRWLFSIITE